MNAAHDYLQSGGSEHDRWQSVADRGCGVAAKKWWCGAAVCVEACSVEDIHAPTLDASVVEQRAGSVIARADTRRVAPGTEVDRREPARIVDQPCSKFPRPAHRPDCRPSRGASRLRAARRCGARQPQCALRDARRSRLRAARRPSRRACRHGLFDRPRPADRRYCLPNTSPSRRRGSRRCDSTLRPARSHSARCRDRLRARRRPSRRAARRGCVCRRGRARRVH